ncbi:hypothetical protein ANN_07069 [Periplaneta americana]|uniref:Uncharacterized protein n=1 Tax=Periplaneta americana TaxID=6978 RepID=A0ABQ8TG64_PERAM|nr:hypothetical protein ANN_07069 [Periplaneta americana]
MRMTPETATIIGFNRHRSALVTVDIPFSGRLQNFFAFLKKVDNSPKHVNQNHSPENSNLRYYAYVRKNSPRYMFRNSSHSCHYRRYRTYRFFDNRLDDKSFRIE